MTKDIIAIDIDGVLADCRWREHLIQESWDAFHARLGEDLPCTDVKTLIDTFYHFDSSAQHMLIGVTGRPERYRTATMEWLLKHDIPLDEVLMRSDKDFRSAVDVKIDLLDEFTDGQITDRVLLVLDDREDIIQAFRQLGVTGMVVHGRDYR